MQREAILEAFWRVYGVAPDMPELNAEAKALLKEYGVTAGPIKLGRAGAEVEREDDDEEAEGEVAD